FAVTKVEYPDGEVVELAPKSEQVTEDYTAYMVTNMLQDVLTEGTGRSANIPGLHSAGKTGTTNDAVDRWFVGYTTNFTVSVWSGYPESNSRSVNDSHISINLYKHMMEKISEGVETPDFERPSSVVEVGVEKGTNPPALPSDFTPSDEIVKELFVKGTEPTKVSEEFDQLDPVSNLTSRFDEDANAIELTWDYDQEENIEFIVSYKEDEGEYRQLTQTSDKEIILENVKEDTTYTFEVIVIHSEKEMESEAKTTSLHTPKDSVDLPSVSQLNAQFNEVDKAILVTWDYNGPPVQFEV